MASSSQNRMNRVKIEPENLIYLSSDDEGPMVKGRRNGRMQSKGEASQGMNGRMQGSSTPVQSRNGRMQGNSNGRMQGRNDSVRGRNDSVRGKSAAAEAGAHSCSWVTPVSLAIQNLKKKQTLLGLCRNVYKDCLGLGCDLIPTAVSITALF
ncbi:hypothetical protein L195_g040765 [Trifolium pratense]|uniref:Uncharacterized protein n=1 Tax=Trifolium pratense TaxID=57577 RepID=A0A2K3M1P6_TRIPR|nr:hypothetical protein L195_g040765 [Trifolium pratense]